MPSAPRVATEADAAVATELLVASFHHDPTWSWAFPDEQRRPEQYRQFWGLCVRGALRYPCTWLADGDAAVSVWIPPGGTDLSPEQHDEMEDLLVDLLGGDAGRVLGSLERFEAVHPQDEPHYYLTLLGTDPARTGRGIGLGLLADNLREVDAAGRPAYLEASNPGNVALYERYGFRVRGTFTLPDDGPTVTTMWREARPEESR